MPKSKRFGLVAGLCPSHLDSQMTDMGFDAAKARAALEKSKWDENAALETLIMAASKA